MRPVGRVSVLILAICTSMAGAHAQSAREDPGQAAEEALEWRGQYGGPTEARQQIVDDASGWTRLWRSLGRDAPPLDFTKYFAVAVMVGQRPTGGYTVEFLDPVPKGADVIVRYRVRTPTGFTTQALAQPWKVRAFPRVQGKVYVEALAKEAPPQ